MPLHNGHVLLIDTALDQCDQITVCLMSRSDEPINGEVRLGWLMELYGNKNCTIVHHDVELPQDDSGYEHWDQYLASIRHLCPEQYDVVFSSEQYGERLANDLGAQHVSVDQARTLVPVSGSNIRSNPVAHRKHLPPVVQQFYDL